ncbi:threonine--tRNA ligase [Candidatus Gracilibacteria bacterium HOT-871]|nr:threonine--tRNA ligase [Candidatus Gracilibacteria bacterium HOT-871]RKW22131.1 MAG: threonine--tRNA ligase [Candidatus Gracilibacteria bacterium]
MAELHIKKHSLAHIMAQAVKEHFPNAKLGIGPATEDGFYYDFDFGNDVISDADLKKIEKSMKKIISQHQKFIHFYVDYDEARGILKEMNEEFKNILIDRFESGDFKNQEKLSSGKVGFSINTSKGKSSEYYAKIQEYLKEKGYYDFSEMDGDQVKNLKFIDMCAGPHIDNSDEIDANSFKLAKIAGAYWLGDAENQQLTRIYAYAFDTALELEKHLKMLEEAKKRDHRILGAKLKLFTISDLVGPGLPLMQPAGMIIRKELEDYLWELHKTRGYSRVWTPHLAREALYECSGHAGHYLEDMFKVHGGTSKEDFFLKPMNCPHHMQLFADNQFSYRDMPIRYFEPATVYRDEKSGQLSGLTRVRAITQDDGHLFCRVTQIKQEVTTITEIIKEFYTTMGMTEDYWVSLSVRGADKSKYLGSEEIWEMAEKSLEEASQENGLPYKRIEGEAAFYGPKLDFMFKDAIGREWQLATIQCDFNLPQRFELEFVNEKGEKERPVVIHRAISGSLERGMGVFIEHFAGVFPLWMAPRQVKIIPVVPKFDDYAKKVEKALLDAEIRVSADYSADALNKKIRNSEKMHNNYILVVGQEEEDNGTVSVRNYKTKEQTSEKLSDFISRITEEIKTRSL